MGNQLQKQYNIKTKPMKLPGAYSFLRFTYHPQLPQSIFIIKSPHKATIMQSSNLILPVYEIKNFSSSNDSFALCPKCVPLGLLKPKSQTQMKIVMYKILMTGSQIGRCFLAQGRIMVWCEEKRSFASMSPEQIEHGKYNDKSKVFTSGVSLLNFLACIYDQKVVTGKKDDKKKKPDPKSQKLINFSKIQGGNNSQDNPISGVDQYTAQSLPQEIKLFFDPKDQRQYFLQLQTLASRVQVTKFWPSISQGLRQLILNMLSIDPTDRVDLEQILKIPYFHSNPQIKLYFMLADGIESMQKRQAIAFMRALELLIKQGTVFEQQILQDYIVPLLISISSNRSNPKQTNYLSAQAVSILIEVNKPPLDVILAAFKRSPAKDKNIVKLAMQKKQKLFYLYDQQRFDSIMSRMIFCSYQSEELIQYAVMSTPFVTSCLKEDKFKKEIEVKLVTMVLGVEFDKDKDHNAQQLFLNGLKCVIQLIKNNLFTSIKTFTDIIFHPLKLNLQTNIHLLYLYGLFIQKLPSKVLWSTMMTKLQPYMSQPDISDQLFTTAHKLSKLVLSKLYKQRKINAEDDINLDYSEDYFRLKDQLSNQNKPMDEEFKKVKGYIQKNQYQQLQWMAKELL